MPEIIPQLPEDQPVVKVPLWKRLAWLTVLGIIILILSVVHFWVINLPSWGIGSVFSAYLILFIVTAIFGVAMAVVLPHAVDVIEKGVLWTIAITPSLTTLVVLIMNALTEQAGALSNAGGGPGLSLTSMFQPLPNPMITYAVIALGVAIPLVYMRMTQTLTKRFVGWLLAYCVLTYGVLFVLTRIYMATF